MDIVQSRLAAGNYVGAIEAELGNQGATATMDISGSQRSVTVAGNIGISSSNFESQPAAIVSLSSAAQNVLSNAQIALDLMVTARPSGHETPTSTQGTYANKAPSLVEPGTGQVISSSSDPSISGIVQQAKNALNDTTSVFYNFVNEMGGPSSWSTFMGTTEQQSFAEAFNSKTLTIQNASNVAGLDYKDNTILSGTSETGTISINGAWRASQDKLNGTYSTGLMIPVEGGIYVTWANPNPSASANSGT
jgi:hypothetical protein